MNCSASNLKNQSFVKSLQDYIQKNKKKNTNLQFTLSIHFEEIYSSLQPKVICNRSNL